MATILVGLLAWFHKSMNISGGRRAGRANRIEDNFHDGASALSGPSKCVNNRSTSEATQQSHIGLQGHQIAAINSYSN